MNDTWRATKIRSVWAPRWRPREGLRHIAVLLPLAAHRPAVVVADYPCDVCGARLDHLHVDQGLGGTSVCSFCGAPQSSSKDEGSARTNGSRPMSLLGTSELLREARERRGETLDQVASQTGIQQSYLEELEEGSSSFDPFPGRVYGRSFLREYAEHLGLESGPLVNAFDEESRPDSALEEGEDPIRRSRLQPATMLFTLLCFVGLLAWGAFLRGSDQGVMVRPVEVGPAPVRFHAEARHAPARHPPVDGIRVVATIATPSWIEARADGTTIYRETADPGTTLTFKADRLLELTLGNAGGVAMEVNGRRHPPGRAGAVAHFAFELRGGRLLTVEP
jgi:transcriptional regulator with XRE-family HTH domain